jgi:hypothetical protein
LQSPGPVNIRAVSLTPLNHVAQGSDTFQTATSWRDLKCSGYSRKWISIGPAVTSPPIAKAVHPMTQSRRFPKRA